MTLVAAAGESQSDLAIIDVASGARRRLLTGHTGRVSDVAFSRDGRSLASSSDDRMVMVWDPTTGERTEVLEGHGGWVHGVDYGADGTTLYSSSLDGTMIAWDLTGDRRFLRQLAAPGPLRCTVPGACPTYVAASPDGTTVSYAYRNEVGVDHFATRDLANFRFDAARPSEHPTISAHNWTPDGRHLVTVGDDKTARLWDPATGRKVAERRLPLDSTSYSIGWRPGSETIFVGLDAGGVAELDADTLVPVREPLHIDRPVLKVDVSPDDRLLAVALDTPPAVQLVDTQTGEVIATLDGLDGTYQLKFSPDGSLLAAGGRDGNLTLVDPAARRPVSAAIRAVDGTVVSLEFSPDGTRIVTAGSDGTVSLWDVAASERIGRITLGSRNITVFAWFGDDGRTIVTADPNGGIWTFPSEPDQWQRHACEIAGRNLTRDEWHELIPGRPYHRTCPDYPASN